MQERGTACCNVVHKRASSHSWMLCKRRLKLGVRKTMTTPVCAAKYARGGPRDEFTHMFRFLAFYVATVRNFGV
jgi:hypothetical protein